MIDINVLPLMKHANSCRNQAFLPVAIYIILRGVLENVHYSRVYATLERVKSSSIKRLLLILTGVAIVALSRSFVRFSVTALGMSSTIFKAFALLLLEASLSYSHDGREHTPNVPNGLLQKPGASSQDMVEDDIRIVRDLAAVVTVISFLLCVAFENLRSYEMVYRPQEGPVDSKTAQMPPVKTIYYNWDVSADFVGVIFESAKAFAMLLMVSPKHSIATKTRPPVVPKIVELGLPFSTASRESHVGRVCCFCCRSFCLSYTPRWTLPSNLQE